MDPLRLFSLTLLQVLPSSLRKMWVGISFPKGVLTWAYSTFLMCSCTLLENTSIFMKVDVMHKFVCTWSSFLVSSVWHISSCSTQTLGKASLFMHQDVGRGILSPDARCSEFHNRHFFTCSLTLEPMLPAAWEKKWVKMLFYGVLF